MWKNIYKIVVLAFVGVAGLSGVARAQAYPTMAPLDQYLMDEKAEIALAKSAAPASISDAADVMVLGRKGYTTAVKGTNSFLCIVERSWGKASDDPEFWNPKMRAPICFNQQSAESFVPIYLMKTKLVLEGKSNAEILKTFTSALDKKELPVLAPGSMCYMLSKQQYLGDHDKSWHPHVMVYAPGDAVKSWGANVEGSPIIAANDPEERVTIFMIWAGEWSDGSPAPGMAH